MSNLFENTNDELLDDENEDAPEDQIMPAKITPSSDLDARKRLEKMLEERRVRDELGEFEDLE